MVDDEHKPLIQDLLAFAEEHWTAFERKCVERGGSEDTIDMEFRELWEECYD